MSDIKPVMIRDYPYNPIPRESFPHSKVRQVLEADFSANQAFYIDLLNNMCTYEKYFTAIPIEASQNSEEPCWKNNWIPPFDGASIYTFLTINNPRFYVECGSGNTTKFAAKAIRDHSLRTKIISIDPHPRAEIDALCYKLYRLPFEQMHLGFFSGLTSEDIFLIDCSHRAFPNSDVTVFFTEVLPELPSGLIYAIHDIALPYELFTERYYNEQYMLAVYIIAGMMGDSFYCPTSFLGSCTDVIKNIDRKLRVHDGLSFDTRAGFFWMKKA